MKGILVKILIFIINFVLWASGILLIVFGGIALGSPSTIISLLVLIPGVSNVTNIMDITPLFEGVSIFMCVLGSLLFLFGGIGCHGAFKMHKRMIMNYWLMLILAELTEIALIIYGCLYPPSVNGYVQQSLYSSLTQNFAPVSIGSQGNITYSSNITAYSWEMFQAQTQCCGSINYLDYTEFNWTNPNGYLVPPTCCRTTLTGGQFVTSTSQFLNLTSCQTFGTAAYTYQLGCWNNAINMVWQFNYIAIIISACLMVTQILGIILTIHTWHKLVREDGRI
jgi:hypothetical protein